MNMYNNLTQQTPYMYGYGMPQYQRMVQPQQAETVAPNAASQQQYTAPIVMQQANYIKGRPVVSIDEARASQIDLDGSLYVFPDLGNKKIYTKQINMDGTASFNVFELSAPAEAAPTPVYVTKDELDTILAQFKESLTQTKQQEPAPARNIKAQVNQPFNL